MGRSRGVAGSLSRLLEEHAVEERSGFGVHLVGSLPQETTNRAPDLVSRATVRQAYFDLSQRWERKEGNAWISLAEEHYGRIVEPNHLQRCLDILSGLPRLGDSDALDRWLAERKAESEAMSDEARQRLFDEWFAGQLRRVPL